MSGKSRFRFVGSHAIVAYLASAYGQGDGPGGGLYPQDIQKRAKVDQWLHFSSSILYNRLMDMTVGHTAPTQCDVPLQ